MTRIELDLIVDAATDRIQSLIAAKNQQYSPTPERLGHFIDSGTFMGYGSAVDCMAKGMKHFVSVRDIVLNTTRGEFPDDAYLDEKFGDAGAYLVLIRACIADMRSKADAKKKAESDIPF